MEDARGVSCLRKKVVDMFCGLRKSIGQSTKESVSMGIEEESNTITFG